MEMKIQFLRSAAFTIALCWGKSSCESHVKREENEHGEKETTNETCGGKDSLIL